MLATCPAQGIVGWQFKAADQVIQRFGAEHFALRPDWPNRHADPSRDQDPRRQRPQQHVATHRADIQKCPKPVGHLEIPETQAS